MLKDAVINAKDVNYDKIQSSEKKTIEELVEEQGEDFPEPVRAFPSLPPPHHNHLTSPSHHLTYCNSNHSMRAVACRNQRIPGNWM